MTWPAVLGLALAVVAAGVLAMFAIERLTERRPPWAKGDGE